MADILPIHRHDRRFVAIGNLHAAHRVGKDMRMTRTTAGLLAAACLLTTSACSARMTAQPRVATPTTITTTAPRPRLTAYPTITSIPMPSRSATPTQTTAAPKPTQVVPTAPPAAKKSKPVQMARGVTIHVPEGWKVVKQVHHSDLEAVALRHIASDTRVTIVTGTMQLKNGAVTLCGTMNRDEMQDWYVEKEVPATPAANAPSNGLAMTTCGFTGHLLDGTKEYDVVITVAHRKKKGLTERVAYSKAYFPVENTQATRDAGTEAGRMMQEVVDQMVRIK